MSGKNLLAAGERRWTWNRGKSADLSQRCIALEPLYQAGGRRDTEKRLGKKRPDDGSVLCTLATTARLNTLDRRQMLFKNAKHHKERTVIIGQIFFKRVLKIEGNSQKDLCTAKDVGYSFHGPSLLVLF